MTNMVDRAKVIRGLECCSQCKCEECPYDEKCFGEEVCLVSPLAKDALAVMKELEPVVPHRNYRYLSDFWCDCGWHLGRNGEVKYCSECGRQIQWDLCN